MKITENALRRIIREEVAHAKEKLAESKKIEDSSPDRHKIRKLVNKKSSELSLIGYQVAASAYRDIIDMMESMGIGGKDAYVTLASEIARLIDPSGSDPMMAGEHLIGTLGVHPLIALEGIKGLEEALYEAADDSDMIKLKSSLAKMVVNSSNPMGDMRLILDYAALSPQMIEEIAADVMENFADLTQTWI